MLAGDVNVIGIDEAQFFDNSIVDVCTRLADNGIRVIVAGLDIDFMGKPFGPVPALMAIAEFVTKVHAICMRCGNLAHYSFRKSDEEQVVVLGEKDKYEPLCRACYNMATGKE
jgi:thymidine kinase